MLLFGHSYSVQYIEIHCTIALSGCTISSHSNFLIDAFQYIKEMGFDEYNRKEVHCRIYLR